MVRNSSSQKSKGFLELRKQFEKESFFSKRADAEEGSGADIIVEDALQRLNTAASNTKWRHRKVPVSSSLSGFKKRKKPSPSSSNIISIDDCDDDESQYVSITDDREISEEEIQGPSLTDVITHISKIYKQEPYASARVFVMSFDKFKFIPPAKSEEQEKRKQSVKTDPEDLKPIDFSDMNTPINNFADYLQDRMGWRTKIIQWISYKLLDPMSEYAITPVLNRTFVIDGHQMSQKQLQKIRGIYGLDTVPDDNSAYVSPIMVICTRNISETGEIEICRTVQIQDDCANMVGESDHLPFFWLNHWTKGLTGTTNNLEIISIDSDSVYISLVYLYNVRKSYETTGTSLNKLPRIIVQKRSSSKTDFIHINKLYDAILVRGYNPIDLMIVLFTAGSDYTDSFYFVSYKCFLEAYFQYHKEIGPLFVYDFERLPIELRRIKFTEGEERFTPPKRLMDLYNKYHSDPTRKFYSESAYYPDGWILPDDFSLRHQGFLQLLLLAYYKAFSSRFKKTTALSLNSNNVHDYLEGLEERKHFPSRKDLVNSFLQLVYYMRLVISSGLPKITQNNPLRYGYKKVDPSRRVVHGNLARIRETV